MHNYFDGDKSLIIVPQSKCILRQGFKEGNEVEVSMEEQEKRETNLVRSCCENSIKR